MVAAASASTSFVSTATRSSSWFTSPSVAQITDVKSWMITNPPMTTVAAANAKGLAKPFESHIGHVTSFQPSIVMICNTTKTPCAKLSKRT